ncbi:MAG: paraquat-inducible protein A [Gammaproteobacteria bacterium]|nr:paraquat-inducible protein A [Gammaproteobacteria bacterium]
MATEIDSDYADCLACPSCDLIFDISGLHDGEAAHCSRCDHFLTVYRDNEFRYVIAFASSALMLLVLSCSFPFMSLEMAGLENVMTLPGVVLKLWQTERRSLALIVAAFIIVIPALMLVLILSLSAALFMGQHYRWLPLAGRLIYTLENWSMVEVFFVGVLVSLVKISHMATVVMGVSFWAYAVFSVFFVLSSSRLDRVQCWRRIEDLSPL